MTKHFGPAGLRGSPVVALASVAGHCEHFFPHLILLFTHFFIGLHILTQLEGICIITAAWTNPSPWSIGIQHPSILHKIITICQLV